MGSASTIEFDRTRPDAIKANFDFEDNRSRHSTATNLLRSITVGKTLLVFDLLASVGLAIGGIVAGISAPLGLALLVPAVCGGTVFLTSLTIRLCSRQKKSRHQWMANAKVGPLVARHTELTSNPQIDPPNWPKDGLRSSDGQKANRDAKGTGNNVPLLRQKSPAGPAQDHRRKEARQNDQTTSVKIDPVADPQPGDDGGGKGSTQETSQAEQRIPILEQIAIPARISAERLSALDRLVASLSKVTDDNRSDPADIRLCGEELQEVRSETEFHYLLNKCGAQVRSITLGDNMAFKMEYLDLSSCSNLESIYLSKQTDLSSIIGLENCQNLNELYLIDCPAVFKQQSLKNFSTVLTSLKKLAKIGLVRCGFPAELQQADFHDMLTPFQEFARARQCLMAYLDSEKAARHLLDILADAIEAADAENPGWTFYDLFTSALGQGTDNCAARLSVKLTLNAFLYDQPVFGVQLYVADQTTPQENFGLPKPTDSFTLPACSLM